MNESSVIGLLQVSHSADSALGALGAQKGSSTQVKDFGRMILREHMALRREISARANDLGIVPQAPPVDPDDVPADMRTRILESAPGVAWDRSYIQYAIAMHTAAMENTARALAATKSPEVKQFIERSVPILQKHLDKARSLDKSLPVPTEPKARPTLP
jgi:putative membrane protein